uniref:Uncharacterized protein n=1 Tax=Rhizophora mucronata TaxID=61149 RepID=A0A2P2NNC3_RHIMU
MIQQLGALILTCLDLLEVVAIDLGGNLGIGFVPGGVAMSITLPAGRNASNAMHRENSAAELHTRNIWALHLHQGRKG